MRYAIDETAGTVRETFAFVADAGIDPLFSQALGMSRLKMLRLTILPQAIRVVVPPLGNYFISLFKDTSLVSTVTVRELMFTGQIIASMNFQYFTIFTIIGIIYFGLSYPSALFVRYLERKMRVGRRPMTTLDSSRGAGA